MPCQCDALSVGSHAMPAHGDTLPAGADAMSAGINAMSPDGRCLYARAWRDPGMPGALKYAIATAE